MCQYFLISLKTDKTMSACNHISTAAKRVTMIRRIRQKKNFSTCSNQMSSIVHQTAYALPSMSSEKLIQVPKYMNTYRLEPRNPFNCTLVHDMIEEVVQKQCFGVKYDPRKCASKVQSLAGEILRRVKNFQFDRYRFVVLVQICSNENQDFETAAKFLWDYRKDRYVTYTLKSGSMFTTATCFGIYQD